MGSHSYVNNEPAPSGHTAAVQCRCGLEAVEITSNSAANPGRVFYKCPKAEVSLPLLLCHSQVSVLNMAQSHQGIPLAVKTPNHLLDLSLQLTYISIAVLTVHFRRGESYTELLSAELSAGGGQVQVFQVAR